MKACDTKIINVTHGPSGQTSEVTQIVIVELGACQRNDRIGQPGKVRPAPR